MSFLRYFSIVILPMVVSWVVSIGVNTNWDKWSRLLCGLCGADVLAQDKASVMAKAPTLVIYVYSGSDPEYEKNLQYFVDEAIFQKRKLYKTMNENVSAPDDVGSGSDACTYIIVLQQDHRWSEPNLPWVELTEMKNVEIVRHPNVCYDLGTIGWVLRNESIVDVSKYSYIIWLNSSVRGPFMPVYAQNKIHWTTAFTERLSEEIKLVGSTINCGGAHGRPPYPHVQSYAVATDQAGLNILMRSGVFSCWKEMSDVVIRSEIGASRAIIKAGYNIDCLMTRYQNIDWRNEAIRMERTEDPFQACNAGFNPIQPNFNDGIDVHPFETLFTKVKRPHLEAQWPHAFAAKKISEWNYRDLETLIPMSGGIIDSLYENSWIFGGVENSRADAERRGIKCFDTSFYLKANGYDLGFMEDLPDREEQAWSQFINMGIYEGRPHIWLC